MTAGVHEVVAQFTVSATRLLDASGHHVGPLPAWAGDADTVVALYRAMVRTRAFDERAVALQRTGRLGTFAASLGQEAVPVGTAAAMRANDVLVPSFREQGAQLWRGVTPFELLRYWGGDERGSDFAGPREDFPVSIPVASHVPHAAGVATAFRVRGEPRVAVCMLGDGGTSKGEFHEALNVAGVWCLPLVVVVANNGWAISVPRAHQSAAATLAQKAIAAGIPGHQVDGNDVLAVREVVGHAVEAARAGHGPTLVEALTYRLGDHTTADDASRYRDDAEVSARWKAEPLPRLRAYLQGRDWWSDTDEEALLEACAAEMDAAAEQWLGDPPPPPGAMFEYLHATLPTALAAQRDAVTAKDPEHG
ncbi:MAG: pyruvate dehydrogenase (acetyl-transferring) E1 component subunit alpha [Chromatiales bacterium]|nr:pyruvate dehydrogenase (acetyl-transferring) E1 component subunit alpha [Chromatiales bacterium]